MKDLNQLKEEKKELFKKRDELQRQIKEHSVTAVEETKIKNDINHLNQEIDKINHEIKTIKSLKIQNFDLDAEEEMEEVLELISNGKSWKRAADLANVPLSKIEYWYAESEYKERKKDFNFMNKAFPATEFIEMENLGHAGMALFRPAEMAERICKE